MSQAPLSRGPFNRGPDWLARLQTALPVVVAAGLAGFPNVEPVGLAPDSAEKFIAALLNWKLGG